MKDSTENDSIIYKKWCRVLSEKETTIFKKDTKLEFFQVALEPSLSRLQIFIEKNYPEEFIPELKQLEVTVYSNDNYQENFILDSHFNLYIRSFLFHTLTQNTLIELNTLVLFFHLQKKNYFIDIILDLVKLQEKFIKSRHLLLKKDEFHVIYDTLKSRDNHFIRALIFVSLLHYPNEYYKKINLIETKNLKEIYFSQKMKKILNLEESDYEYIQDNQPWEHLSKKGQNKFTVIKNEFENNRISIEEYVQNYFERKKILFWCMWTISPFLAIDINRLFSAINEYKSIQRVYLDLPQSSQEIANLFISDNHYPEVEIEKEIKKIYPSVVNDYAKETLPYIKILERLQLFKIPQFCIGEEGDSLSKKLPYLKNNRLEFEIDEKWEKSIHKEMQKLNQMDNQELIIFFYFLKPMNYLLPYIKDHEAIETLIHTDPFTGYGPNQCENRLSYYSHFHPQKQKIPSFILHDLNRFSLKEEKVVFFPYKDDDYIKINDDHFNRFCLYNTLLFSGFRGGGGSHQNTFSPSPNYKVRV